jgi:four helix bundle protein
MPGRAVKSFEELHIYQRARELTNAIYSITRAGAFARDFGLVNQLRRAAVSVMSNIAEGFERGASVEFIQFLFLLQKHESAFINRYRWS